MNDETLDHLWHLVNRVSNETKKTGNFHFAFSKSAQELHLWFLDLRGIEPSFQHTLNLVFPTALVDSDLLQELEEDLVAIAGRLNDVQFEQLARYLSDAYPTGRLTYEETR